MAAERTPRLFSYVVARDYGFAPNPFYGYCTLATCKPKIRSAARVGDWIVGTGSADSKLTGKLIYAMQVGETLSYDEYWTDPRFQVKKPNLAGSRKQTFGDNIYHHDQSIGAWLQDNSHHSLPDGSPNMRNVENDTSCPRVLVATNFVYFGQRAESIPDSVRYANDLDLIAGRGHKSLFPPAFVNSFVRWVEGIDRGFVGQPINW